MDPLLVPLAAGAHPAAGTVVNRALAVSAVEHRMDGLLWRWVEAGALEVEPEALSLLAPPAIASRRRSARLSTAAVQVSEKLGRADLQVAVFKGIAAEKRWYISSGDRRAVDLDLWLAPHQLGRVDEVVEAIQPDHPLVHRVSELASSRRIRSVDLVWNQIPIDLHFDPFKFGVWYEDLDAVWVETEDLGDGWRAMGPAAELLNALIHLNKDRFSRLLGFVDVVRASAQPDVADGAWQLAKKMGISVPVACSAQVVGDTLGVEIPIPPPPPGWRTQLWSRLWREETRLRGNEGYTQMRHRQDWIPLLCDDRFSEAARHLRHVWFPPRALLDYFNPHVEGLSYPLALWRARIGHR